MKSGQNIANTLQYPTNVSTTKTTNANINSNNLSKYYQLKPRFLDENSLQQMKDIAFITFKNLAPDCDNETNRAFNTSINHFLSSLLKEAPSNPQPPQNPIGIQQAKPAPANVQIKKEPQHNPHEHDQKDSTVDEPIDLNEESHTNDQFEDANEDVASVLIPADENKPAPPFVAVLECLAK